VDGGLLEVDVPARPRVDIQLWACGRGGLGFVLLFLCDTFNLCVHIVLDQCVDDLFEWGSGIEGVSLEELGR